MKGSLIKKILHITFWTAFVAGLLVMVGFVESEQNKLICKGLNISLNTSGENSFLTREEVKKTIYQLLGDSVTGKRMKEISISLIRERLEENPYVSQAIVFATVDGWLKVEISQRTPIIRVQNMRGETFYISDDGRMIPVSFQYTARVPFANGYISESYNETRDLVPVIRDSLELDKRITTLQKIYLLGQLLQQDALMKVQTEQVYITSSGEIEIIPLAGNHVIQLGSSDDLQEKLDKLKAFYQNGLRVKGWSTYKSINIKYKNQIICLKN